MKIAAFVLLVAIGGLLGYALAHDAKQNATVAALRDTIRITDSVITLRTDTVVKYQRRVDTVKAVSDALDSLVVIRDDSSAIVADTVAVIPPEVVADLRALRVTVGTQDTLIRSLYGRDSTQEWRIATRDKMIRELSKQAHPLCGRKCGYALGVASVLLIRKAIK